jgi:polar amino acid transport system substrate-binding protein
VTRAGRRAALAAVLTVTLGTSGAMARPLDAIRDRGVLSLCAHANALPFASKTQDPPGFQIELARALAAALGVTLHVEWVVSGIQFRVADCDIVLDTIAVAEAQAERRLQLSRPYQRSGVGLAVRPDARGVAKFDDMIGHQVAVQGRSLAAMLLAQRGVRLTFFGYEEEMVDAVARGEIEAAAVSPATAGYFNLRHPQTPVRFVHAYDTEPELRWNLAVGLRRADAPLRDAIDAAIDRLVTDGTVARIYSRYGIEHRPPPPGER